MALSDEDFNRTKNALRDLVRPRNNLVHHFIDQHDMSAVDGCRIAHDALIATNERIDHHVKELRLWADQIQTLRTRLAEVLKSEEFQEGLVAANDLGHITEGDT